MQMNEMPSIGTTLTYGEAIKAYERFERTMLEKAYGAELLPAVGLYDLLWQLESLAQKFGIEGKGAFSRLKREIRSFSSERAALANGVNGERFYLLQDESALRQHDETHLFKVGIDGASAPVTSTKPTSCFRKSLPRPMSTAARIRLIVWNGIPTGWAKTLHEIGRNWVLRDDGLLRNLGARPFGLPDRFLLQVVYLVWEPLNEQSFIQFANSWASHLRLLTFIADGEDLRPGVLQTVHEPPALIHLRLQLAACRLKGD